MASSGDGEPVQYLYTPDLEDEFYQQNLMLTHPTNILRLDEGNRSTLAGGSRFDGDMDDQFEYYKSEDEIDKESVEVVGNMYLPSRLKIHLHQSLVKRNCIWYYPHKN